MSKNKIIIFATLIMLLIGLAGCKIEQEEQIGEQLEYTIVEQEDLPEILVMKIEEEKVESFKFSYSDGQFLYIAIGYGEQPYSDYSIQVDSLNKTKDNVIISTKLLGPSKEDATLSAESYPYIVVKTQDYSLPVCFK